jgi:hypothetical protein
MAYFKYFNEIGYDLSREDEGLKIRSITNVLNRTRKKLEITNAAIFEQYFINDGDRADTLAYQYYDDSTLHWIIMYANYMTNPYYDWPLTYFDLQKYVAKKYDNINGIHHYEDSDGNVVDAPNTIISPSGRTSGPADAITNFVYEERLNDQKRVIDIIRVEYVEQIVNEFKELL